MMEYITINGKNSLDFGVGLSAGSTFDAPERDVTFVTVPGRSGDLTFDNGRWNNIDVTFPCWISNQFETKVKEMRAYLKSLTGYQRIEDTYNPDVYRLGVYSAGLEFDLTPRNKGAYFDLVFNCKPQRFFKSGERTLTYTEDFEIYNPTFYPAYPLIRVYDSGTLTVGDYSLVINDLEEDYIDIDCEARNAFYGDTNLNNYIEGDFPILESGVTSVTWTGTDTTVEITPRWWTL